jgi:parallel beta-helix repeat protein
MLGRDQVTSESRGFYGKPKLLRNIIVEHDHEKSESIRQKEPKLLIIVMAVLIVAVLFASSISLLSNRSSDIPPAPAPAGILYIPHGTISINGNAAFAAQATAESWPGDGSSGNPYIIQNYSIDASSADGISLQNTNIYFIIRDCYIYDTTHTHHHYGIWLTTCLNGIVSTNSCSNSQGYSIVLSSSNNNIVSNNNCSNNWRGIVLDPSNTGNTISNNTCSSNSNFGIYLGSSSYNDISNNTCSNSWVGVYLYSSSNSNIISNNTCNSNSVWGYGILLEWSSNSNIISNNTCGFNSGGGYGIYIRFSSDGNTLTNNNCSNNVIGIILSASSNIIAWNEVCNNTNQGVYIGSGSYNRIWNNTLYHNNGSGDTYIQAKNQALDSGGINWWNSTNGYGNYWADWTTPDVTYRFGIVDLPYNITGPAGAKDYYPLTSPKVSAPPISEFSELIIPIVGLVLIALAFGRTRKKP